MNGGKQSRRQRRSTACIPNRWLMIKATVVERAGFKQKDCSLKNTVYQPHSLCMLKLWTGGYLLGWVRTDWIIWYTHSPGSEVSLTRSHDRVNYQWNVRFMRVMRSAAVTPDSMAAVALLRTVSRSEWRPGLEVSVKVGHSTSLHSVGAGQILRSEKLEILDNYYTSKIHLEWKRTAGSGLLHV